MNKSTEAFRTISEVASELGVPKHVLRFWEGKFPQVRPMKRGGGRRYYRPEDLALLRGIRHLLHSEGYTIKGVQKILREQGIEQVKRSASRNETGSSSAGARKNREAAGTAAAGPKPGKSAPPKRKAAGFDEAELALVQAAISELEVCRGLLQGRKKQAAATKPARTKKRA